LIPALLKTSITAAAATFALTLNWMFIGKYL
jgi:hypothetical protein